MKRYILALFLPTHIENVIKSIRNDFAPEANQIIPPHISLSFPFCAPEIDSVFLKKASALCKKTKPISIILTGYSFFGKEEKVLYLTISPEKPITRIHQQITEKVLTKTKYDAEGLDNNALPKYKPHITLSLSAKNTHPERIKKKIGTSLNSPFIVDTLGVLSNEEKGGPWKTEHHWTLTGIIICR